MWLASTRTNRQKKILHNPSFIHLLKGAPASEKKYAVSFFFNASLTELTDYVIRHISKYSKIMSLLSSNSAGFCPNSVSFRYQKPQGLCVVFFLH